MKPSIASVLILNLALLPAISAQTLLNDAFSGSSINASNWSVSTPFSDSTATVASGALSLANGAAILSASSYPAPIEVTFSFAFTGSSHDSFRVYTRVDAFNPNGYAVQNGVGVSFRLQTDTGNTNNNVILEDDGVELASGTFALAPNTFYDVRLVDTGDSLTLYLNGDSGPFLTASSASLYGDSIVAFNREGAGNNSYISAGSVTSLNYLNVTAVPEPSTYAFLAGLSVFGICLWQRRGRRM